MNYNTQIIDPLEEDKRYSIIYIYITLTAKAM